MITHFIWTHAAEKLAQVLNFDFRDRRQVEDKALVDFFADGECLVNTDHIRSVIPEILIDKTVQQENAVNKLGN